MLDSPLLAGLIGVMLGLLAGLGVGGGSLLILWLTLVLHMDHAHARTLNLLFFIVTASTVSLFRWRKGLLKWDVVLTAALPGCIFAFIFTWIGKMLDPYLARKLLGILFIFTGVRELLYRPRKAK